MPGAVDRRRRGGRRGGVRVAAEGASERDPARSRARLASRASAQRDRCRGRAGGGASPRQASMPTRCRSPTAARGPSTCSAPGSSRSRRSTRSGGPRVAARAACSPTASRVVEAAEAIPLDPARLDVLAASSRGLGQWIAQYRDCPLVVDLGGTATMDAGAGLLEVARPAARADARALRRRDDAATTRRALFGPQKGATSEQVAELEARFRRIDRLAPFAGLPGSGRGRRARRCARLAGRGAGAGRGRRPRPARLRSGALRPRRHREGRSTRRPGRARRPLRSRRRCAGADVRCVVFGGLVEQGRSPGTSVELARSAATRSAPRADLVELGERLGRALAVRRRVAASPSSGAAPTRSRRSLRPAAGTPRR